MREIVPVSPGRTYKFRLINGGVMYGLRISIANLKMTVVAADSEPIEPVVVDEVFLHAAERFDVEVTTPDDWAPGERFWIRADTVESSHQGYQDGVRAILSVVAADGAAEERSGSVFSRGDAAAAAQDPAQSIASPVGRGEDHVTLNCFEREAFARAPPDGRCVPIDALRRARPSAERRAAVEGDTDEDAPPKVHFINSHFQPYPQHSHFMRLNDGPYYQHVNPKKSMLDPTFTSAELHPNTAMLHVPAHSSVVLVWRTTTLMDHPMHLCVET